MAYNFSGSNQFTNTTNKFANGGTPNDPLQITYIITIIINIVTSPLTVLLNVLVIMAVIRRPRLQSYPNILLACLAATDVLTGLISQPSFILFGTFHHHHHQSLFIHEIISLYMVFLRIVFKSRLKYSRELLTIMLKIQSFYLV